MKTLTTPLLYWTVSYFELPTHFKMCCYLESIEISMKLAGDLHTACHALQNKRNVIYKMTLKHIILAY